MKPFLQTKAGIISVTAFVLLMGFMFHRVAERQKNSRQSGTSLAPATRSPPARRATDALSGPAATAAASPVVTPDRAANPVAENAAYLDQYYGVDRHVREDRDRHGNPITHRATPATPADSGRVTIEEPAAVVMPSRPSLRLHGRTSTGGNAGSPAGSTKRGEFPARPPELPTRQTFGAGGSSLPTRIRPKRFNPYGNVVKCELVFTLDSTNEQTPFIGVVMEPVYNNGQVVIPAGAELHGVARPDRLRDRIFSGSDWVLVFPRDRDRPNGRQLNVKGVALDRVEPDGNGMTWGISDGSYGLEGTVIRTMNDEEIKRFAAIFFASGAQAFEDRQTDRSGQQTARNNPQNAVLQGLAANFQQIAEDISAEIARHGVFIRVPAGHQFYFYPMQIIDPDAADVSSDIASVK